ncbi:MAG: Na+/H+ antiporter subunit E [Desulfobacteraceae bacterium]|nr:Na+/H+ antiporter subunit E [Desulfobacteraceae bacterium]
MTISKNNGLSKKKPLSNSYTSFISFSLTFILMFGLWIVLSGKFDFLLISLGLISSFIVSFFFYDLLFPNFAFNYLGMAFRFSKYLPWLLWEIIKANFHLLFIVFHPRLNELIDPHIIVFKTNLKTDIAIATMANSITLTPGTITVSSDSDGVFRVHAIDKETAEALPGEMLERVAKIFGEEK